MFNLKASAQLYLRNEAYNFFMIMLGMKTWPENYFINAFYSLIPTYAR
jgi:hypothetical protein